MNEQKNNGKGIFYGVIGVATLIVAIIGATFAYFTASQDDTNTITGNAATISFGLAVEKVTDVDDAQGGIIPMTNGMVEAALTANENTKPNTSDTYAICQDENENAVCQVYQIKVTNTGSANVFLDGYVNLTGGSGTSTDVEGATTTMRWAQAFCEVDNDNNATTCTTTGDSTVVADDQSTVAELSLTYAGTSNINLGNTGSMGQFVYGGSTYDYITSNHMRTSGHTGDTFVRDTDITSGLVYSQLLGAEDATAGSGLDELTYYIVVWLSETGTDQTLASGSENDFFSGRVDFLSATGGEVSATFGGYTRRPLETTTTS